MAGNQIEVLKALDAAEIAGTGFFTDSYYKRGSQKHGTLLPNISAAVTGVALCGTLQLFFGWVDDKLGRKRVYGITLMLMAVSAVASVWPAADNCHGYPLLLHILARVWDRGRLPPFHNNHAGIYQHQSHGLFIAAVFNMQGSGIFAIVISAIFDFDGKFKVSKGHFLASIGSTYLTTTDEDLEQQTVDKD